MDADNANHTWNVKIGELQHVVPAQTKACASNPGAINKPVSFEPINDGTEACGDERQISGVLSDQNHPTHFTSLDCCSLLHCPGRRRQDNPSIFLRQRLGPGEFELVHVRTIGRNHNGRGIGFSSFWDIQNTHHLLTITCQEFVFSPGILLLLGGSVYNGSHKKMLLAKLGIAVDQVQTIPSFGINTFALQVEHESSNVAMKLDCARARSQCE
mmetsp:Transcript_43563/g.85295  ORF Transcript_43563/g.85295 Transcript_43563/m.85295 type:complete len:213 (-) Transcript_43563:259-897(-)